VVCDTFPDSIHLTELSLVDVEMISIVGEEGESKPVIKDLSMTSVETHLTSDKSREGIRVSRKICHCKCTIF
jgi:hypothetical protein